MNYNLAQLRGGEPLIDLTVPGKCTNPERPSQVVTRIMTKTDTVEIARIKEPVLILELSRNYRAFMP